MKKRDSQILSTILLIALAALYGFWTISNRAVITGSQDAGVYLGFARQFVHEGLRANLFREPVYPLFLAFFIRLGLEPVRWAPIVQSLIFLGVTFLALRSLWPESKFRRRAFIGALSICGIPSIALTLNGALYTESLSASFILLELVFLTALWRQLESRKKSRNIATSITGIIICNILLALNKGSFIYIQYLFPFLLLFWNSVARASSTRKAVNIFLILLFAAVAGRASVSLWFGLRAGEPVFSKKIYARGGALLYGRVEYARTFDFVKDSPKYLLNALSESACRSVFGPKTCDQYTWDAEGQLGWALHGDATQGKLTDEQLFDEAKIRALKSPVRQFVFIFYENSRFILHHSMNGFARTSIEPVSRLLGSKEFALLLKLFNLALYLFPLWLLTRNPYRKTVIRIFLDSNIISFGTCYAIALLAVHGFIPTLVRMCFPVVPVLLILNLWGLITLRSKN